MEVLFSLMIFTFAAAIILWLAAAALEQLPIREGPRSLILALVAALLLLYFLQRFGLVNL